MKLKLPNDAVKHELGEVTAYTIPVDGFQKLIAYNGPRGNWVHQDHRVKNKKTNKKRK